MAEQRPSSMLFSLRGMMDVEPARVAEVAAERRAVWMEARTAEQEALRDRELGEAVRQRDRVELLIALQRAEANASIELLQREHAHALRLAELRAEARKLRDRQVVFVAVVIALVTLVCALGLYFGKLRPESERLHRAYDELAEAERQRAEAAQGLLERTRSERDHAARELAATRRELGRTQAGDQPSPAASTRSRP